MEESKNSSAPIRLAGIPSSSDPSQILKALPPVDSRQLNRLTPDMAEELEKEAPPASIHKIKELLQVLPNAYGNVRELITPPGRWSDKTVIHIQDVHMNAEAQANIGKALQEIINGNKAGIVGLEGAFNPIDVARYRAFPDRDVMRAVADFLLRENKISGPIHTALTSESPIPAFIGVDDPVHYGANVEAYRRSYSRQKEYRDRLAGISRDLAGKKSVVFNADLRELDDRVQSYRENRLSLGDYIKSLAAHTSVQGAAKNFIEALSMEAALNFAEVEKERAAVIQNIIGGLSREQIQDLLNRSVAYRMGQIRHTDYYAYLRDACRSSGVDLARYKSMDAYIRYVLLSDRIDAEELFQDIQRMEESCYAVLAKSGGEKDLVDRSKSLYLARKLVDFALTPDEWSEYRATKKNLGRLLAGHGPEPSFSLASFEAFYEEAEARNDAIAANLLKAMDAQGTGVAVLVTGGFHTRGIEDRLRRAGAVTISYVPKLTRMDASQASSYLDVFTREKTPLEKLFAGEKLFMSPHPSDRGLPLAPDAALAEEALKSGRADRASAQATRDLLAPRGTSQWEEVAGITVLGHRQERHDLRTVDGALTVDVQASNDNGTEIGRMDQTPRLPPTARLRNVSRRLSLAAAFAIFGVIDLVSRRAKADPSSGIDGHALHPTNATASFLQHFAVVILLAAALLFGIAVLVFLARRKAAKASQTGQTAARGPNVAPVHHIPPGALSPGLPSGDVLSLGVGDGEDEVELAEISGRRVFGVTLSKAFVDQSMALARRRGLEGRLDVQLHDMAKGLPYRDGAMALVYARLSIHYLDRDRAREVMAEVRRVLAPGGRVVIIVKSDQDPYAVAASSQLDGKTGLTLYDVPQPDGSIKRDRRRFYSEGDLQSLAEEAGLKVTNIEASLEQREFNREESALLTLIAEHPGIPPSDGGGSANRTNDGTPGLSMVSRMGLAGAILTAVSLQAPSAGASQAEMASYRRSAAEAAGQILDSLSADAHQADHTLLGALETLDGYSGVDRDQLIRDMALLRRERDVPSESERGAFLRLERAVVQQQGEDLTSIQRAAAQAAVERGRMPVGTLVVNRDSLGSVDPMLKAYEGLPGIVVLAVADPGLEKTVQEMADRHPQARSFVKVDGNLTPAEEADQPPRQEMRHVEASLEKILAEGDVRQAVQESAAQGFRGVATYLDLPTGWELDWTGFKESWLIAKERTFIADLLRTMRVDSMRLDVIGRAAALAVQSA